MARRLSAHAATTPEDIALLLDSDGLLPNELSRPDVQTWRRTLDTEAVRFTTPPDPEYALLAGYVIGQAVCDARCTTSPSYALLCRRARRWLRRPSSDLAFWCTRAGIDMGNLVAWAAVQFPKADDPRPGHLWLTNIAKRRRMGTYTIVSRGTAAVRDWEADRPDLNPLNRSTGTKAGRTRVYAEGLTGAQRQALYRARKKAARVAQSTPASDAPAH